MNRSQVFSLGATIAVASSLILAGCASSSSPTKMEASPSTQVMATPVASPESMTPASPAMTEEAGVVNVTVKGGNFAFDVKEIKVKKGDKVKITFLNEEGFHDWVLDEFSAKTPQITAGKTAVVEFTADKVGTFEYYCSVGQHRKNGMVGSLIVE